MKRALYRSIHIRRISGSEDNNYLLKYYRLWGYINDSGTPVYGAEIEKITVQSDVRRTESSRLRRITFCENQIDDFLHHISACRAQPYELNYAAQDYMYSMTK